MGLVAPFPYFGGKSRVAAEVWRRFGQVRLYIEPFFGSGAVLLGRPEPFSGQELVNDKDGFVANFWRALKYDPEKVAWYADNPPNETDLVARHIWLVREKKGLLERLQSDPEYYDPKAAGWWAWGMSCWIGGRFCSGTGPWWLDDTGRLVRRNSLGVGIEQRRACYTFRGVLALRRKGILQSRLARLSARLRNVIVMCGEWSRTCVIPTGPDLIGIFLDPPYNKQIRDKDLYIEDTAGLSRQVREWCLEHGENPRLRIALCGCEGEHEMPDSWAVYRWTGPGGYGKRTRNPNRYKETIWFSPACLGTGEQPELWRADATRPQYSKEVVWDEC